MVAMTRDGTTTDGGAAMRIVVGGMCALAVSNGFARFAFTPLLPFMQADVGFDDAAAGLLASCNYAGYLAGALAAGFLAPGRTRSRWMQASVVLCVASVLGMAVTEAFAAWAALRFLAGLTGGLAFVLGADIAARRLAAVGQPQKAGLLFSGVAAGIAVSGAAVLPLDALGGWQAGWAGLGVLGIVVAIPALAWLADAPAPRAAAGPAPPGPAARPADRFAVGLLWVAYLLFGLGYVVSATFLVAILQRAAGGALGPLAWCVVGLAGIPATWLCTWAAGRFGLLAALVGCYLILAVAIGLPALSTAFLPAMLSAALFGAMVVGVTMLGLAMGRRLTPASTARTTGVLTVAFGLGQIVGPVAAGWTAQRTGSFDLPLALAAALVAAGAAILIVQRRRFAEPQAVSVTTRS